MPCSPSAAAQLSVAERHDAETSSGALRTCGVLPRGAAYHSALVLASIGKAARYAQRHEL